MFTALQPLFEKIHRVALSGLNAGGRAGDLQCSGEKWFLNRLARFYPKVTTVALVDAGAHAGDYSALFQQVFSAHSGTRILALEPSPALLPDLQKRFSDSSHIQVLPMGLSDKKENLPLFASTDSRQAGLNTLYARRLDHFNIQMKPQGMIAVDTLDAIVAQQPWKHVHLLKLDIEGHELAALRGAAALLAAGQIDFIQFEFGGCNIDSRTFFQDFYYLLSPHYALARLLPDGLRWIDRYREEQEIFVTTNFIAVRKTLHANFLRD